MLRGTPPIHSIPLALTRSGLRAVLVLVALVAALSGTPRTALAAGPGARDAAPPVSSELVLRALSLLGVHYRFGGNSPESGLDCSGLVRYVFREAVGLALPRRAEEMSRVGEHVNEEELRPGDLVFFNTLRRAFSHVGIYIGEGRFVHAPSTGKEVSVEVIDRRYWQHRFNGGRRLLAEEAPASRAQATNNNYSAPPRSDRSPSNREVDGSEDRQTRSPYQN